MSQQIVPTKLKQLASILYITLASVHSFSPSSRRLEYCHCQQRITTGRHTPTQIHLSNIIDAEVIPDDEINHHDNLDSANPASSLIEYSQNQDPDWKSMPVAFCDTASNTYIDCNLAFYAKDPLGDNSEGAEYALGVPCEVPIVVALELDEEDEAGNSNEGEDTSSSVVNLSKVIPINPDDNSEGSIMRDEEKEEIFQMAARALMDEFGKSIRLKKTPRVLTIEGDLDGVLGDWKEILMGNTGGGKGKVSFDEALNAFDEDDEDEDEDFFDKIMKRDLGPDYMSLDDDDMDEELLKLFAGAEDIDEDLDELLNDISAKETKIKDGNYEQLVQKLQPSASLRLLNFLGPGGKEYTILRPLRPILLVGKEDPEDYTRRILLTEEEKESVLPRLERSCREGLEEAGFFLTGTGEES